MVRRIWHQVDGQWKWYPANRHHLPVKKASTCAAAVGNESAYRRRSVSAYAATYRQLQGGPVKPILQG